MASVVMKQVRANMKFHEKYPYQSLQNLALNNLLNFYICTKFNLLFACLMKKKDLENVTLKGHTAGKRIL